MMKLVSWAQSIVTFRGGSSEMLSGVAFVFRVHLVPGMAIFLLFPFTRLVHVWSASSFGNAQAMMTLQSKENINETADLSC